MLKKVTCKTIDSFLRTRKINGNLLLPLIIILLVGNLFSQNQWGNSGNPWSVKESKINSKHYYENTVAVIAPGENPNCKNGKVIVMTGQPRDSRRIIISDYNPTNDQNISQGEAVTLGIDSNIESLATDNQIVKLKDGSLLAVKLGFLWSPINPKPFWSDWISDETTNYKKGARDAIFIYKSTDCGATWDNISKIDAAKTGYGIPKPSKEKAGEEDDEDDKDEDSKPNNNEALWHSNGFDRQEVYYDHRTEKIYITTQIASGGYLSSSVKTPGFDKYGVFMSSDNGKTWNLLKNGFTDKRIIVMTASSNGRFFMFSASGGKPVLYFTKEKKDFNLSSLGSVNISCKKDYPHYPDKSQTDKQIHQFNKLPTFSIAEGYSQGSTTGAIGSIYVSYPVLNHLGKGEFMIVKVDFINSFVTNQLLINQKCFAVKASDKDHSLGYGTFVESTEQQHLIKSNPFEINAKTLFFYLESTAGDNFKGERKAAFKGLLINNKTNDFSPTFFLSKDNNNNDRWFKPYQKIGENKASIGHYTKGAYFVHQKTQNYAAQWSEPDGIHVSIISGVELWKKK